MIYTLIMQGKKLTFISATLLVMAIPSGVFVQRASAATTSAGDAGSSDTVTAGYSVPEIYLAARNGNLGRVRSLIADGTDVNAVNFAGRTALMSAVYFQNTSIVRELLGEGADVNARDANGRTALMLAVTVNNPDLVEELIAAGADVSIADNSKNTAMSLAERSTAGKVRKKKLVKLLEAAAE